MQIKIQMLNSHIQAMTRLEVQMSQLANSLNERPKRALPSLPFHNPKNTNPVHMVQDLQINQCNIVHTLHSKEQVDNRVFKIHLEEG